MTSKYRIGSIILTFNQDNLGETGRRGPFKLGFSRPNQSIQKFSDCCDLVKRYFNFLSSILFRAKRFGWSKLQKEERVLKRRPSRKRLRMEPPKEKFCPRPKSRLRRRPLRTRPAIQSPARKAQSQVPSRQSSSGPSQPNPARSPRRRPPVMTKTRKTRRTRLRQ